MKILLISLLVPYMALANPVKNLEKFTKKVSSASILPIGYSPWSSSSVLVSKQGKILSSGFEVVVVGDVHEIIPQLSALKPLDPKFAVGAYYSVKGSHHVYLSVISEHYVKEGHGIGVKAFFNQDLMKLNDRKAVLSAYYFFNLKNQFKKYDILSAYIGWFSEPLDIDLSAPDKLLQDGLKLLGGKENVKIGIDYIHKPHSDWSVFVESSLHEVIVGIHINKRVYK